jgi:hypothetical protein
MSRDYETASTRITVVEGVEVDLSVRGDEKRAEKVLIDLKERLAVLAAAFDHETPPGDLPDDLAALTEEDNRYTPPMSVAWDRVFTDETDDDDEA